MAILLVYKTNSFIALTTFFKASLISDGKYTELYKAILLVYQTNSFIVLTKIFKILIANIWSFIRPLWVFLIVLTPVSNACLVSDDKEKEVYQNLCFYKLTRFIALPTFFKASLIYDGKCKECLVIVELKFFYSIDTRRSCRCQRIDGAEECGFSDGGNDPHSQRQTQERTSFSDVLASML